MIQSAKLTRVSSEGVHNVAQAYYGDIAWAVSIV